MSMVKSSREGSGSNSTAASADNELVVTTMNTAESADIEPMSAQQREGVQPSSQQQEAQPDPEQEADVKKICGINRQSLLKLVLLIALVTGLIIALTVGNLDERIGDLFEWVDDNPVPGAFIFVGVYALVTTVFFPSSILTLAGGAIFGFGGIALVWIGAVAGQTGSFFVSRYLLRDWVAKWGDKYPVWSAVDAAIRDQALKIVILLRLATIVPYSATNALLPVTSLSFLSYTIGSAVGIIPGVILFVLIGTLATSVADVISGNVDTDPTVLIVTIVLSIVIMFIVVALLTRYAKKALAEQTAAAEAAMADAAAQEAATVAAGEGTEAPAEAVVPMGEEREASEAAALPSIEEGAGVEPKGQAVREAELSVKSTEAAKLQEGTAEQE